MDDEMIGAAVRAGGDMVLAHVEKDEQRLVELVQGLSSGGEAYAACVGAADVVRQGVRATLGVGEVSLVPEALSEAPHVVFAARFIAAHVNEDRATTGALFRAAWESEGDQFAASMTELIEQAADTSVRLAQFANARDAAGVVDKAVQVVRDAEAGL